MTMTQHKLSSVAAALAVIAAIIGTASFIFAPLLDNESNATVSSANDTPYRAGPFRFGLSIQPTTPRVGENTFTLVLNDADGNPVADANIEAIAEMPAMGSMAAMRAPADIKETSPGTYMGTFEPYMEGSWPLSLRIGKEELGSVRVNFDLATGRKGLQLSSGATNTAKTGADSTKTDQLPYRSGEFMFDANITPRVPRVGKNTLSIRLKTVDGEPIDNASISAIAEMPAMGSMAAMRAPADMEQVGPGEYKGNFEPYMEGSWPLTLEIAAPGIPERRVNFDLATGREGIQLSSGASRTGASQTDDDMMEEAPPGAVTLDSRRTQMIGVKKALAEFRPLTRSIRTVGKVDYDQTRISDVTLKFDAWIGELYADAPGKHIRKDEPLFTVYSPELLSAQQEYLELRKRSGTSTANSLLTAARKRLLLWDMSAKEITALEQRGTPFDYVVIRAPRAGVLVSKNIVEGSSHRAGMTLLRIADLSQLWIEADVYEADLALVSAGMRASISLPNVNKTTHEATVVFVYPYVDAVTRTARLRFEIDNADGELKPDMYAQATLIADLDERLAVPEAAVIIAGQTRYVFEDIGDGRFAPRKVKTGVRADGYIEILDGLDDGDCVVTSGNFLIASESRLKAGIDQW